MVMEKIKKTISENSLIEKGGHIILGLSGGPDSVCLFHILKDLREEFDMTLHAVHVNHKIRPGAAEEDQEYVERLCREFEIPCHTFEYDINKIAKEKGISTEDAGRQARYDSFYNVAESIKAKTGGSVKIAVAQNMNDQAETVLMRIMRGTGTDGLSGIEYQRSGEKGTMIIRPLLDISREEIEEFCRINHFNPRIDHTNSEPIYTRNKIRLELLPYMKENFNVNVIDALNRLSGIAKKDKDYFSRIVDEEISRYAVRIKDGVGIPVEILRSHHPSVRHRIIMRIFESIGLSKDIGAIHLEQADQLLSNKKTSSSIDFSAGYAMRISYDQAELYRKTESNRVSFEYVINMDKITEIPELNGQLGVKILRRKDWLTERDKSETTEMRNINREHSSCYMSYDKIEMSNCMPTIRTRKQGDFIRPLGMKGKKKLQDFFVDEKIKKEDRERTPLLSLGCEILWVVGSSRINENYKVEENTEKIITLEYNLKI